MAATPVRSPITDDLPKTIPDDPPPFAGVMLLMVIVIAFWTPIACIIGGGVVWLLERVK